MRTFSHHTARISFFVLPMTLLIFICIFPADSYKNTGWYVSFLTAHDHDRTSSFNVVFNFDSLGRLISSTAKLEVDCPIQSKSVAVILTAGQSNVANHAELKVATRFPGSVFNYFGGRCFVAASPLLGATGEEGEFVTLVGDRLIESGTYKSVVIVSAAVQGSEIARWEKGGDLNEELLETVSNLRERYMITEILWHQGESDFSKGTTQAQYVKSFDSLRSSLIRIGVIAPIFIAVATRCHSNWELVNSVSLAQMNLVNESKAIFAVNTDTLLDEFDRRIGDVCHLSKTGQTKVANKFADAIIHYRRESSSSNRSQDVE